MDKLSDWPQLLRRTRDELSALGEDEFAWLRQRLAVIESIQLELNVLFVKAGGLTVCQQCDGACCDCGRHHITLTNLLGYLLPNEEPPAPDFSQPCPYLGADGCALPVSRRPYNCITFFCEALEAALDVSEREKLRTLDRRLRSEYERVAARHPGASLRGFWIASARRGKRLFTAESRT